MRVVGIDGEAWAKIEWGFGGKGEKDGGSLSRGREEEGGWAIDREW